ncbi:hypothetical protein EDB89DRAFT_2070050 [Lactarius sanguifluus]|nr:hypothetical protein EDB89DRAFT_2070050 [Lactarius sanguifluus]
MPKETSPPPSQADILAAQLLLAKVKKKCKVSGCKTTWKENEKPVTDPSPNSDQENESTRQDEKEEDSISWSKNADYTDKLLTALEGSVCYRKAFGFAGGDLPGVTSGGLTNIQMCCDIAAKLFPTSSADLNKLAHNKIQVKFKWYKRLHALLNESPIFDTLAVVHGASTLNLGVLSPTQPNVCSTSPDWNYLAVDQSFEDACGDTGVTDGVAHEFSPTVVLTPSLSRPVQEVSNPALEPTTPSILKQKNPFDHVKELSEKHHLAKLERARLRHAQEERALTTQLEIEQMKLTAQCELATQNQAAEERRQQHELVLMDRQLELAHLRGGPHQIHTS